MSLHNGLMMTAILGRNLLPSNKLLKKSVLCATEHMYRHWPGNVHAWDKIAVGWACSKDVVQQNEVWKEVAKSRGVLECRTIHGKKTCRKTPPYCQIHKTGAKTWERLEAGNRSGGAKGRSWIWTLCWQNAGFPDADTWYVWLPLSFVRIVDANGRHGCQ